MKTEVENILNRNDIIWNLFIFTRVMYSLECCTELGWRNAIGKRCNSNEKGDIGHPWLNVMHMQYANIWEQTTKFSLNWIHYLINYIRRRNLFSELIYIPLNPLLNIPKMSQTIPTFQCSRFVKWFNVATINFPLTVKA